MQNSTPTSIFFSYSAKDSEIANRIFGGLNNYKLELTRDTFKVKYTEKWNDFMDKVKDHDFLIFLVSKKSLLSVGCMYEVLKFQEVENFEMRILPIMIDKYLFDNPKSSEFYVDYWNNQVDELESQIKKTQSKPSSNAQKQLTLNKKIRSEILDIINFIRGQKVIEAEYAIQSAFGVILRKLYDGKPDQQFEKFETVIYNTLIASEIDSLNEERRYIINSLTHPQNLKLLTTRRFKFGIQDAARNRINKFIHETNEAQSEIIQALKKLEGWTMEKLITEFFTSNNPIESRLIGHIIREKWEISKRFNQTMLLDALEIPKFPYYKIEVIAELIDLVNEKGMAPAIAKWLEDHLTKIAGSEETEAWALLCESLKRFDNQLYQQIFARAHYIFLKERSTETNPYNFPLLMNISGFQPTVDTYTKLLNGDLKDNLAAVWVLSYFGGIHMFLCDTNESPVELLQQSKDALLILSKADLEYKDKWRLCCAAIETHLLELTPWIKVASKSSDMMRNYVNISHSQYGTIYEPQAGMAIRACGYFAYLLKRDKDLTGFEDLADFLNNWYENRKPNEDRSIEISLATAIGYLGNAIPLFYLMEQGCTEIWLPCTVENAALHLTDRNGKEACKLWIQRHVGKDKSEIEENPNLPEVSKGVFVKLLRELEARIGFLHVEN